MYFFASKYFKWVCLVVLIAAIFFIIFVLFLPNTGEQISFSLNSEKPRIKNQTEIISAPTEVNSSNEQISLIAVGDVMLSRTVGQKMRQYHDFSFPFLKTADFLKSADFTMANLETSVYPGPPVLTGSFNFRADPESLTGLTGAGVDLVSLANNHSINGGIAGLRKTLEYLKKNNLAYLGAGENLAQARKPYILEKNGLKIAFLAYTDTANISSGYWASENKPGVCFMDLKTLPNDIKLAKTQNDLVIVLMHSGTEYTSLPNKQQIEFAHSAIDSGADLVIGSHPHWIQEIENYQGKYIFYSLGNFVFDQMWSQKTREGLVVKFYLDKSGVKSYELYPVIIEDYSQPRWANEEEKKEIIKRCKN